MILSSHVAVADILDFPPSWPLPGCEAEVAENREQVAEALSWVQPRWRGAVTEMMFYEARRWLNTAGTWDLVTPESWIAGARIYVQALAPPAHREQAELLVGHDAIAAAPSGAPVLESQRPERLAWLGSALAADPAAMIHAAAALTAWLWGLPGAVRDPGGEQIALAQRGLDDLKKVFVG